MSDIDDFIDIDGTVLVRSVSTNGVIHYQLNKKSHRLGGPAFVSRNGGRKVWCYHGHEHRLDGPAVEDDKLGNAYFVHGRHLTRFEFEIEYHNPTVERIISLMADWSSDLERTENLLHKFFVGKGMSSKEADRIIETNRIAKMFAKSIVK